MELSIFDINLLRETKTTDCRTFIGLIKFDSLTQKRLFTSKIKRAMANQELTFRYGNIVETDEYTGQEELISLSSKLTETVELQVIRAVEMNGTNVNDFNYEAQIIQEAVENYSQHIYFDTDNLLQWYDAEIERLSKAVKTLDQRKETTYLNIIGAFLHSKKEICLKKIPSSSIRKDADNAENQTQIIDIFLTYKIRGLSERTLKDVFASANITFDAHHKA